VGGNDNYNGVSDSLKRYDVYWRRTELACDDKDRYIIGGLATRKLSVRLSVGLSVERVICDKTKESCAHILIPHKR